MAAAGIGSARFRFSTRHSDEVPAAQAGPPLAQTERWCPSLAGADVEQRWNNGDANGCKQIQHSDGETAPYPA
jgi:hypothetical protein